MEHVVADVGLRRKRFHHGFVSLSESGTSYICIQWQGDQEKECEGIQYAGNVAGISVANIRGLFAGPRRFRTAHSRCGFRYVKLSRVQGFFRGMSLSILVNPLGEGCQAGGVDVVRCGNDVRK